MAPAMKRPNGPDMNKKMQKPGNAKATFVRLLGYLGKSKAMLAVVAVFVLFNKLLNLLTMIINAVC